MQQDAPQGTGRVIGGDFRLLSPIAEGGMGAVWRAEQLSTGRQRALKVMLPDLLEDARERKRFMDEARVASRLRSDHVVEIIATGVDEVSGSPFIAMELLQGRSVAALIEAEGPQSLDTLKRLFGELGHGLGEAHASGIVHRDLKPENLFLAERGRARPILKILDFGIASVFEPGRRAATVTRALGTPLWMAPEQAQSGEHITAAVDVWALGLIAFHVLTGKHYWQSANGESVNLQRLLAEVLVHPLEPPSVRAAAFGIALPEGFDEWFGRCVVRDPAERFANASEAVATLSLLGAAPPSPALQGTQLLSSTPPAQAAAPSVVSYAGGSAPGAGLGVSAPSGSLPGAVSGSVPSRRGSVPGSLPGFAPTPNPFEEAPAPRRGRGLVLGAVAGLLLGAAVLGALALLRSPVPSEVREGCQDHGACLEEAAGCYGDTPGESCHLLGMRFGDGEGVPLDRGLADQVWETGCEAGDVHACADVGRRRLRRGEAGARERLARACDAGFVDGCAGLAQAFEEGRDGDPDLLEGTRLYRRACEAQDADGCAGLAQLVAQRRVPEARFGDLAELFVPRCADGNLGACVGEGVVFENGLGALRSHERAREVYARACEGGRPEGCTHLATLLWRGLGGERDEAEARALYERSCREGDPVGCIRLAKVLPEQADRFRARACDAGLPWGCAAVAHAAGDAATLERLCQPDGETIGCAYLAHLLRDAGDVDGARAPLDLRCANRHGSACRALGDTFLPDDPEAARAQYRRGCEGSEFVACAALGRLLRDGEGGPRNLEEATVAFSRGCEGGEAEACFRLGVSQMEGRGAPRDDAGARRSFAFACDASIGAACTLLARLLRDGRGGDGSQTRARELFRRGCERGDSAGCVDLAYSWERQREYVSALPLYQRGCDLGNAVGCNNLGWLTEQGRGRPASRREARALYERGCGMGNDVACRNARRVR
jgi:TPR repeat protein/serine/threonine protein kinase